MRQPIRSHIIVSLKDRPQTGIDLGCCRHVRAANEALIALVDLESDALEDDLRLVHSPEMQQRGAEALPGGIVPRRRLIISGWPFQVLDRNIGTSSPGKFP